MTDISVGDNVEYVGTETDLWRKQGIVQYKFEYNPTYDYTAFIVDFPDRLAVVIPSTSLIKITPKNHS